MPARSTSPPVFRNQSLFSEATDVDIADFAMLACRWRPQKFALSSHLVLTTGCHQQEVRTRSEVAMFYPLLRERFGPSNCMKISKLLTSNAGT